MFNVLLTSNIARQEKKSPYYFSRFDFEEVKRRNNTHFCFHCTGGFGFKLGKDGEPSNHMAEEFLLYKEDGSLVLNKEALEDADLEPNMIDRKVYIRRKPEDPNYEEWLTFMAYFAPNVEFEEWCGANSYKVQYYNPMKDHDPVKHASAVIGGVRRYKSAGSWLMENINPKTFPYIVCVR